jgi:transposase InsO family protein
LRRGASWQMRIEGRGTGRNRWPSCSSHPNAPGIIPDCDVHRHVHYSTSVLKMTADELTTLYEELSYPSAAKFRRAVQKRGDSVSLKDALAFVQTYGQQQVTAPRQKYQGKIVSDGIDDRWAADLVSFTAQPAKTNTQTYTHILCVQDIFSRKIWSRALPNATSKEVTLAFKDILRVSDRICKEINTDAGTEFIATEFKDMLKEKGINLHRVSDSRNDIATLDRAMGSLKTILTKRTVTIGAGNWAQELKKATNSYNNTQHEHLGVEAPNEVETNKSLQFDLQVQASKDHDVQHKVNTKRRAKLEASTFFREENTESKGLKGLPQRGHKPRYQEELRTIGRIEGKYVYDTEGRRSLAKRILPVPEDTRDDIKFPAFAAGGDQRIQNKQQRATVELVTRIAATLTTGSKDISRLTVALNAADRAVLKLNKLTMKKLVAIHPETFTLLGRKVSLVEGKAGASSSSDNQPPEQKMIRVPGRKRLLKAE